LGDANWLWVGGWLRHDTHSPTCRGQASLTAHLTMVGWEAVTTFVVVGAVLVAMGTGRVPPHVAFVAALVVLVTAGVLKLDRALAGLSNQGMLTVAALLVLARALERSGALRVVAGPLLHGTSTADGARSRILGMVTVVSAFINDTPVVAMLLPRVLEWARLSKVRASEVLIPLSYAALLGGMTTLLGTSTNLVAQGVYSQLQNQLNSTSFRLDDLGMFTLTPVGVPAAAAGAAFLCIASRWLLPKRPPAEPHVIERQFQTAARVLVGGKLEGSRVGSDEFRSVFGDAAPTDVIREDLVFAPGPVEHNKVKGGDVLLFAGLDAGQAVELRRHPSHGTAFTLSVLSAGATRLHSSSRRDSEEDSSDSSTVNTDSAARSESSVSIVRSSDEPVVPVATATTGLHRTTVEAMLLPDIELSPRTVAEHAVIVASSGRGIPEAFAPREADVLLLDTTSRFLESNEAKRLLHVFRSFDGPVPWWHAALAASALVISVALAAAGVAPVLVSAGVAISVLLLCEVITLSDVRQALKLDLLVSIASALGLGAALVDTGAIHALAQVLVGMDRTDPNLTLGMLYLMTVLTTELVTNTAAVSIMLPLAVESARQLGISPTAYAVAVTIAASAAFVVPTGYATNIMVMRPGGYQFRDYARIGVPLSLLVGTVVCLVAPVVYPFFPAQ
jgi:di/tricarboxylate transporter